MKIAIISSNKWKNKCRGDIFLKTALNKRGVECQIVSWQEKIDWNSYELLILRSPWDYHENYADFIEWLKMLEKDHIKIANGAQNIMYNIDKECQFQMLSLCEIPLVPYFVCNNTDDAVKIYKKIDNKKIVVKPSVSASGYNTFLVESIEELSDKLKIILESGKRAIMQPFVPDVLNGEVSLVYFHGVFSHSIMRFPGVIGQRKKAVLINNIEEKWLKAGEKICQYLRAHNLLYVRIDLINSQNIIYIMEIELAEPDLYLDISSNNELVDSFVSEIIKEINKTRLYEKKDNYENSTIC